MLSTQLKHGIKALVTTLGTGNRQLTRLDGFLLPLDRFSPGDTISYSIADGFSWEWGTGTVLDGNIIEPTTIAGTEVGGTYVSGGPPLALVSGTALFRCTLHDGTDLPIAFLNIAQVFTKAQRGNPVLLESASGHIAINFGDANNYYHELTEDTELDTPSDVVAGQQGIIEFKQNPSSIKALSLSDFWQPIGSVYVTSTPGERSLLSYSVNYDGASAACIMLTVAGSSISFADAWAVARLLAGNSVDGSANVPFANKFLVQGTADAGLTGAQFMGALATGILKNTTTTGVQSIAGGADLPAMSATVGGAVPTPPNDATQFLNGQGAFANPLPQALGATSTPTFAQATISNTPVNPTDTVNKAYADAIAQGLQLKPAANEATTAALPTYIYNNGSSGVGATLTAVATGVLILDGQAVPLNDVVLVKNETAGNAPYNGLYLCTVAGAIGVAYVLTRIVEMNAPAEFSGAFAFVVNGTVNAGTGWACSDTGTIVVGTTNITFVQFSGAGTYTADGTTLQLIGTQFSLKGPVTEANGGTGAASIGLAIDAATAKTTLVDADETVLGDSAAAFATKKVTFANVFAYIKTKLVATANAWTGTQSGVPANLTSASNVTAITGAANNFKSTLTENSVLGAMSGSVAGASGIVEITQHASSAKTFTLNAFFNFGSGSWTMTTTLSNGDGITGVSAFSYVINSAATAAICAQIR